MDTDDAAGSKLGQGRSAVVFRCRDAHGRDIARKIFVGDRAANIVHYVCSGAPNPYGWNEDAIRCALHRRAVLSALVEYWFGPAVRVAGAHDVGWNTTYQAYALDTDFVEGRPASLHHPFSEPRDREYDELVHDVMRPLQAHLMRAGLDGLVWQAGRGNPVALGNFLHAGEGDAAQGWVWVDLESGVPALAPLNPLDLLRFYLPRSWRHGRPLFDDVDVATLRRYVVEHHTGLEKALGAARLADVVGQIDLLEHHQRRWRAVPRLLRGITARLRKGEISEAQAEWYRTHAGRWYAHEIERGVASAVTGIRRRVGTLGAWLLRIDYRHAARAGWRFLSSQRYRAELARRYIAARIDRWQRRRQLTPTDAGWLRGRLHDATVASYVTDFGVHIAIKPLIKVVQLAVVPVLFGAGLLSGASAGMLLVGGGLAGRTAYTLGRMGQAAARREPLPWVAFLVGLLPVIGNAAYPVQIVYNGADDDGRLAAFILYDTATTVGERVPIWGGADSAVEHWLNHLADLVVRNRASLALASSAQRPV